jgi:serine/threonine protein kinase
MTQPPVRKIGKYENLAKIGRGGFAVVYKARDPTLDRVVALKVLKPSRTEDPVFVRRFLHEAKATANLYHPHIVTVYEVGEADGHLYIAMAYLSGRTLAELLEAEGALPLAHALPILEQIADALDYAHRRGVIHRDVKPGTRAARYWPGACPGNSKAPAGRWSGGSL